MNLKVVLHERVEHKCMKTSFYVWTNEEIICLTVGLFSSPNEL